jgi:hypothetical protein
LPLDALEIGCDRRIALVNFPTSNCSAAITIPFFVVFGLIDSTIRPPQTSHFPLNPWKP